MEVYRGLKEEAAHEEKNPLNICESNGKQRDLLTCTVLVVVSTTDFGRLFSSEKQINHSFFLSFLSICFLSLIDRYLSTLIRRIGLDKPDKANTCVSINFDT